VLKVRKNNNKTEPSNPLRGYVDEVVGEVGACESNIVPMRPENVLKQFFNDNISIVERMFGSDTRCSYDIMIQLIERVSHIEYSRSQLSEILYEEYIKLLPTQWGKIIQILRNQGKNTLLNQIQAGAIDEFHALLVTDQYWLSNLDIWLLALRFVLPIILVVGGRNTGASTTKLLENGKRMIVLYSAHDTDEYIILKQSSISTCISCNTPIQYTMMSQSSNAEPPVFDPILSINIFSEDFNTLINEEQTTLMEFITNTAVKKRRRARLRVMHNI
jgi:hypothetical protein